jgi:hypothetical protein
MVARFRVTPVPEAHPSSLPESEPPSAITAPAHAYLARLAALHDEAAETAHLANLLGRSTWIAGMLGIFALITQFAAPGTAPSAVWLGLMAIAIGTIGYNYTKAIAAPFDRDTLKNFAKSFSACLIYAGAAWGAGVYLALPASPGIVATAAFPALAAAVLAGILRSRALAFSFLIPAIAIGAFCAVMRDGSMSAALGIVAAGFVVAAALTILERFAQPAPRPQAG